MTAASRLIILAGFLAGSAIGYLGLLSPGAPHDTPPATDTIPAKGGRAPELHSTRDSSNATLPLPSATNINNLLRRYTDFSAQETKEEFTRLFKALKDSNIYNPDLCMAVYYLAYKLGIQSPEDVKQFLQDKKISDHPHLFSALLEGWTQTDFQSSMDYLLEHKKEATSSRYAFNILSEKLAKNDPDRALQWLSTLTPGERTTALQAMAEAFPLNHPEKMAGFLKLIDDKDYDTSEIYAKLSGAWAVTDWEAVKAWSDTLSGNTKSKVLASALSSLSKKDLLKATEELKKTDRMYSDSIGSAIVRNFSSDDNARGKALDWVMENLDYFSHPESVIQPILCSSSSHSPELTQKILKLPEGKIRDSALEETVSMRSLMLINGHDYTGGPGNESFLDVLALAAHISDSQTRQFSTSNCVDSWIRKSPEEARKWISETSQLTDQEKQDFLQTCDDRQKKKKMVKARLPYFRSPSTSSSP